MLCARASRSIPSRVNTCTSITMPFIPDGTRNELSLTSDAFSPKMARSNFSSGANCVDFSADMHNAGCIQTGQLRLRQIRDIAGNFFCAQLGIPRNNMQLFDMD